MLNEVIILCTSIICARMLWAGQHRVCQNTLSPMALQAITLPHGLTVRNWSTLVGTVVSNSTISQVFVSLNWLLKSAEHSVCLQLLHLCQSTNLQPKNLEILDICASQNSFGPQLRRKERNQQKVTGSGYILLIFFRLRWSCLIIIIYGNNGLIRIKGWVPVRLEYIIH